MFVFKVDSSCSNDVSLSALIDYSSQNVAENVDADTSFDVVENIVSNADSPDISFVENISDFDMTGDSNDSMNENFDNFCTLNSSTNCTIQDAYIMIYSYAIRHDLTQTAIEDLIKLVNNIIGNGKLSPSKYTFKKKFGEKDCTPKKHFTCGKCDLYLGTLKEIEDSQQKCCQNCNDEIQTDTKYKKNHFVTIPLRNQLKTVLEQNSNDDNLEFDLQSTSNAICDVHDSISYHNLRNYMPNDAAITLTLSTDGAPLFKSTKEKSVWPIQLIINEIKLEHRFERQNMLCAGVAFGKTPNMQTFFKPFIDEVMQINAEGGLSFKMNGELKKVKIVPMIFTGDTLAKQYVLKKTSFNGYMGCPYCLHGGTLVKNQIRYCSRDTAALRTNDQTRIDMFEAQATATKVNGYNGISPLIAFDNFDIINQVAIDKMHCIDIGVIKRMFNMFFDTKNRSKGYV